MGNSEVGHLNIGAGRVVYMDITKIDLMIENGEFFSNPALVDAMKTARTGDRRLHLFGLLSDGGVHSHQNHLYALLRMAKQNGVERVFVHCFMDGRDTLPTNGAGYIEQLQQKMREYGIGKIASVSGRYYAMDRDKKWEREKKAFDAMVYGDARRRPLHRPGAGREGFLQPGSDRRVHHSVCRHRRSRRARGHHSRRRCLHQLQFSRRSRAADHALPGAQQPLHAAGRPRTGRLRKISTASSRASRVPKDLTYVCMTRYDKNFTLPVVSPPESLTNILANVMADRNLRNLRVAETEKYAHVTYFFNGGVEKPFPGEERVLVQSPKVATYDLKPEMSAQGVADAVVKAIADNTFDVMVVNFANADMVGHSGKIPPTITAVETVDALPGPDLRGAAPAWRGDDRHRRPRQRRADDRSRDRRPADGAHHQSRAVHRGGRTCGHPGPVQGRRAPLHAASRRRAARHCADHAGDSRRLPQPKEMTGHDLRVFAESEAQK